MNQRSAFVLNDLFNYSVPFSRKLYCRLTLEIALSTKIADGESKNGQFVEF